MTAERQPGAAGWRARWQAWRARGRARTARRDVAWRLYAEVVNRARTPRLFSELGVPDTPEGRFEAIALHAALVLRRLRREGAAGDALGQALFELMFADVDVNLRELGVGDLSVGRAAKRWARHFYARLAALERTLDRDPAALAAMLAANVYPGGPPPRPEQVADLVAHLRASDAELAGLPAARLLAGDLGWGAGEVVAGRRSTYLMAARPERRGRGGH